VAVEENLGKSKIFFKSASLILKRQRQNEKKPLKSFDLNIKKNHNQIANIVTEAEHSK